MTPLAIIAGSARDFWHDWSQAPIDADVFAVNHAGLFVPRAQHLVSVHAAFIGGIALARASIRITRGSGTDSQFLAHAPSAALGVTNVWPEWLFPWSGGGGTSALFAVRVALHLGYERVVLVGVPLDASGHVFDPPEKTMGHDFNNDSARAAWDDPQIKDRVRSYSGWTRAFFGAPER